MMNNHASGQSKVMGRGWWRATVFAVVTWLAAAGITAAASQGITIAVTGDIHKPGAKVVSDTIVEHPEVTAVLLVGDTVNGKVSPLAVYKEVYEGTYGRFMAKLFPCPGNHDALDVPPFSGYCQFWGKAAHAPEMYYSFDLGGWHIVSLDSVNLAKGGDKAGTQLEWLRRDLAAKPKMPVLAYWHYPYFSNAKHHGMAKMKPYWDAVYAHGPALVMNGHNHIYERFAPMNADGEKVAETKGIQEFVVGPGGASPTKEQADDGKGPSSEKIHLGAQHVGYFKLFADGGFTYTIESITSTGEKTVVDKGAGNLSGKPAPAGN
jgi:acid phosphatase type 7